MNRELLEKLVPKLVAVTQGAALTREVIAMTLEELGRQVRAGKHLPDDAVDRAEEDQLLLEEAFKTD